MFKPLVHRLVAPFEIGALGLLRIALEAISDGEQTLGRIRAAVKHHVLASFAQFGVDLFIHLQLARVNDAHVHASGNCVEQEDRVHRLANVIVAAK